MLTLTFEITLKSNYHIGAGYGKGFDVDSALLREADGTPALRGSELTGLARDGVYRLLKLPLLQKYPADETLGRLFGTSAQTKSWRFASAYPQERCFQITQPVQRVCIDPRTRRAKPHELFSQEEGLAGQKFHFAVICPYNNAAALDEAAFLVAGIRNVRQLGRSRRRGLGECVIHLTGVDGIDETLKTAGQSWEKWFLIRFDQVWLRGKPIENKMSTSKSAVELINVYKGSTVRLRVIARLDEPLLIAQRVSAGNQFDTCLFIPGSVLLGALAGRAAQCSDLANPEMYSDFVSLFLRGGITFPMLYPAYEYQNNLYPAIPAPFGLVTCSVVPLQRDSEGHGAYPAGVYANCPKCDNRLEPVNGFIILKRGLYIYSPSLSSEMHINIDKITQRVVKGSLYGYTVLNAGQYFVGELHCAGEVVWQRLQEMTGIAERKPLTLQLGKARQRGYGQATVWLERCVNRPPDLIQWPLEKRVVDPAQPIALTLLSDTVITNAWGQKTLGFGEDWLEALLELGPLEIQDAYAQIKTVDGFNATLGLPRWRDTALSAGSMARISLKNPPGDWITQMQKLETEGIGLRRNEGYGRVVFNHPVYEHHENLKESDMPLDLQMRLHRGPEQNSFILSWEEKLEDLLPSKGNLDNRFTALARWLHGHSGMKPETLLNIFASEYNIETNEIVNYKRSFGQPDESLITAIGEQEYGQRAKDNFFTKDCKNEIRAIWKALTYLRKEDGQHWRCGIERLAGWINALTREKGGQT